MKTRYTSIIFFLISILAISCGSNVTNNPTDEYSGQNVNSFNRNLWKSAVVDSQASDIAPEEKCPEDPMAPIVPDNCYKKYFESLPENSVLFGFYQELHNDSAPRNEILPGAGLGNSGNFTDLEENNNENTGGEGEEFYSPENGSNIGTDGSLSVSLKSSINKEITGQLPDDSQTQTDAPDIGGQACPYNSELPSVLTKSENNAWQAHHDCKPTDEITLSDREYEKVGYDYGSDYGNANNYCDGVISKKITYSNYTFKFEPTSCLKMCDKYPEVCM